jgi:endo-1,4-beta-xylanase
MDLEGANVARILNDMGIAAFILKSRLANTKDFHYKVDVESLADAQRAIRTVRARAAEFRVDTAHVGIMGFSAGGELAAYAETRWDRGKADAADPTERQSSRPDFVVLGYPGGKAANLTFTKETPPTFIVVNNDDNLAPNSTDYYAALRKAGVHCGDSRVPSRRTWLRHDGSYAGVCEVAGFRMARAVQGVDARSGLPALTLVFSS